MSYVRLALLSTAISLTAVATPAFAQTFNGFYNKDPAVTQGYAPYEAPASGYYNGWNNGPPVIGPVFGVLTAPFSMATGGWGEPANGCHVDRDFNGRYTSVCGL
jgi:hypothetical protein